MTELVDFDCAARLVLGPAIDELLERLNAGRTPQERIKFFAGYTPSRLQEAAIKQSVQFRTMEDLTISL